MTILLIFITVAIGFAWAINFQCQHEWELIREVNVFEGDHSSRPIYTKRVHECKKCKKIIEGQKVGVYKNVVELSQIAKDYFSNRTFDEFLERSNETSRND